MDGVTLVLGGGGQFGAWQAGFWLAAEGRLPVEAVVGASIGSVNGWAIASGVPAEELAQRWRHPGPEAYLQWRWPTRWLGGLLDSAPFDAFLQEMCSSHQPRVRYGCAILQLRWLRRRLVQYPEAGWKHLAASCALFGLLPTITLDGDRYIDGGTLEACPMWAAAEMGARRVLAVDIWNPGEWQEGVHGGMPTLVVRPRQPLGGWRDMLHYDPANAPAWIEMGRQAGEEALRRWA